MGLAEKRIAADCQNQTEAWKAKLDAACGKSLELDIDWDTVIKPGSPQLYPAALSASYITPAVTALNSICADKIGKDAFTAKIAKIKITSDREWSSMEAKVEGDTLHLDADPTYTKDDEGAGGYADTIIQELEKNL